MTAARLVAMMQVTVAGAVIGTVRCIVEILLRLPVPLSPLLQPRTSVEASHCIFLTSY